MMPTTMPMTKKKLIILNTKMRHKMNETIFFKRTNWRRTYWFIKLIEIVYNIGTQLFRYDYETSH